MIRALLIDDEPPACEILRTLLTEHGGVTVVAEAGTLAAARTRLAAGDYDLVFLDIQLRGGTGFDLVPAVRPGARIIFVTAFDAHAIRAFEVNALDYLLKPVSPARLAAALQRFAPAPTAGSATPFADGDRVYLKGERSARFVPLAELSALVASDNYTEVHVADGARFLVRRSLKAWEAILPAATFLRVHRQILVNLAQVERIDAPDSDTPALHLRGFRQPVVCSHRLSPELRRRLPR
jgi:two-component system LytT family response regulator